MSAPLAALPAEPRGGSVLAPDTGAADPSPESPVTGVVGDVEGTKTCVCGRAYKPRQKNQAHCSSKCYDRAYNLRRPVVRQQPLPFAPEPIRVARPPHNPALVRKLKPATLHVLGLLGDGLPHTRQELARVGGIRYSARVAELREAGHCVLGPTRSPRHGIFETEPLGPDAIERYRLRQPRVTPRAGVGE